MISFDLLSDGLIEPEGERGLGFFDWMLWVNAGLHSAQALHARYKRRAHLPSPDLRFGLRREYAVPQS